MTFSSHELVLARLLDAEIDPFGFAQVIALGTTWDSWTRFVGIQNMAPCQLMIVEDDLRVHRSDYWTPHHDEPRDGDLEEQQRTWLPVLRDSVQSFHDCSGATEAFADFTAGEDSRLIVATCHALEIPFTAFVGGADDDTDVVVAKQASEQAGFDLIHRPRRRITRAQVTQHASEIVADSDGYKDLFLSCQQWATEAADPLDPAVPKFGGIPGGEAFRGAYYLRGKALRPDANATLDLPSFLRRKYLLDHQPGLLRYGDRELLPRIHDAAESALHQVQGFPVGTQIDHLLRLYQTCGWGMRYRHPVHLPFATGSMTRSIYWLRPRWKRSGRLTRACTEMLWPELARIRTQNGVPTVRKTLRNQRLFIPGYLATARAIARGYNQRVLKRRVPQKIGSSVDLNREVLDALLRTPPYSEWFSDPAAMMTGHMYEGAALNAMLEAGRSGASRSLPILGRVLSQELALRWCSVKNRG
jgi:hypothetical protein